MASRLQTLLKRKESSATSDSTAYVALRRDKTANPPSVIAKARPDRCPPRGAGSRAIAASGDRPRSTKGAVMRMLFQPSASSSAFAMLRRDESFSVRDATTPAMSLRIEPELICHGKLNKECISIVSIVRTLALALNRSYETQGVFLAQWSDRP
jgi:hypothetical protein